MTLKGQRIVVLGGTSGIGYATAEAAAAEGAVVVVASSRDEGVKRALAGLPSTAEGRVVDLASEDGIRAFFESTAPFDHLVYTAGEPLQLQELGPMRLDAARVFFNLRFWGALTCVKYAREKVRRGGSIVLTSGVAKDRPQKGWTVAASICGAVEALTRALAVELAPIRVNAVAPGVVRTPLWKNLGEGAEQVLYREVARSLPVGRVGEPQDIAEAYLYLMRERFSTGQVVTVDGGTVLV